jgi:hypothetical protein
LQTPNTNLRAYDFYHNNIALSVGEITVKKTGHEISFTADLDFGPQADFNAAGVLSPTGPNLAQANQGGPTIESVEEVSKVIGQIFLTYTPTWARDLTIEFGKMATHMGYEGWKAKDNWQYSRSTLFLFGIPLWHTGLHLGYNLVPQKLSVSGYVYNGWNTVYEVNGDKTLGAQLKWTPSEALTWIYNYIGGPEQPLNNSDKTTVHESNFALTLSPVVSLALEAIYGHEANAPLIDGSIVNADWMGGYVASKFSLTPKYFISPRFEVYRDNSGANLGGPPQTLYSATLTQSYKVTEGLETRLELRADASTYKQRFISANGLSNNQSTVTLGVIYSTE